MQRREQKKGKKPKGKKNRAQSGRLWEKRCNIVYTYNTRTNTRKREIYSLRRRRNNAVERVPYPLAVVASSPRRRRAHAHAHADDRLRPATCTRTRTRTRTKPHPRCQSKGDRSLVSAAASVCLPRGATARRRRRWRRRRPLWCASPPSQGRRGQYINTSHYARTRFRESAGDGRALVPGPAALWPQGTVAKTPRGTPSRDVQLFRTWPNADRQKKEMLPLPTSARYSTN